MGNKKKSRRLSGEVKRLLVHRLATINLRKKKHIASGSYGDVYKVPVKIKAPDNEEELFWCALKGGEADDITKEIKLNSSLTKHDKSSEEHNIIKLIAHLENKGRNYALYPFCQLILGDLFKDQKNILFSLRSTNPNLHLALCIQLALDLLKAINYMHSNGIVHRDIKLHNIGFHLGKWCLLDLGCATDILGDKEELEQEVKGTALYLHPRCINENSFNRTTNNDIYALGQVLNILAKKGFYEQSCHLNIPQLLYQKMTFYEESEKNFKENPPTFLDEFNQQNRGDIHSSFFFIISKMVSMDPREQPKGDELFEILSYLKEELIKQYSSIEIQLNDFYQGLINSDKRTVIKNRDLTFFGNPNNKHKQNVDAVNINNQKSCPSI
ncbi:hypothetical protein E3983_12350 [Legionella israelensis]|uniref:Protein kinase domain-containing protein n=1 Tax=Legionella israelensis TaxID=454 RepID=A0AAX1EIV1_9GAMM|nr:protein kinase [Legionella israelensis]QBR85071.1 hypothetical protein E3983_12350 [Legionella israelensis]